MTRIIDEEKWLTKMNKEYAVVLVKNRVQILMEKKNKVNFISKSDFFTLTSNQFVKCLKYDSQGNPNEVKIPIAKWWLDHEGRRQYSGLDFDPSCKLGKDEYNLFRGWPLQPQQPNRTIENFLELLKFVICGGSEEYQDYLTSWLAHLIQKPWEKLSRNCLEV